MTIESLKKPDAKYALLASGLAVLTVLANILTAKQIQLGPAVLTAGIFVAPLTFPIGDTINEVYGGAMARRAVLYSFAWMIAAALIIQGAIWLPPAQSWHHQAEFVLILGSLFRFTLASLAAYLVSQLYNVWVFQALRRATKGRHLWLRNNLSTLFGQTLDSAVFVVVAFAGTLPWDVIGNIIVAQCIVKYIFALLDTPFVYALVGWARKSEG